MSGYSYESYSKYESKVLFMQDQLKHARVGSIELQKSVYTMYACALTLFRKFYKDPADVSTKVLQHMGRIARKLDKKFNLSVTQLSAFRHFCVLVPCDQTEQQVLEQATENVVQLLEYAIEYPEIIPTRHDLVKPVFDEDGLLYKESVEVLLVPKPYEVVSAMTKNFADRLSKLIAKFKVDTDVLEYIAFAHQFASHLHKSNAAIPKARLDHIKDQVNKHFTGEVQYQNGKVPRLPPQDLIESVYIACLTQFRAGDQERTVGRDMFGSIYTLHDQITKQVVQPDFSKLEYTRYLFNVAVLSTQSEYKIKYDTDFWPEFRFKELQVQDVYHLINQEWKLFNSEWQLPKSEYKHHVLGLHQKGTSRKAKKPAK